MKKYGAVSGAIFGLLGVLIAVLGLVSTTAELFLPIFFPISLLMRGMDFAGILIIGILLNMILFTIVGYYLSLLFKNKWTVPLIFGAVIVSSIIIIIIEAIVFGLSA